MNLGNPYQSNPYGQLSSLTPEQEDQFKKQRGAAAFARGMAGPRGSAFARSYADATEARTASEELQAREANSKGGGGGILGGLVKRGLGALSDKRSKEQIQKLESANAALTQALSSKAAYPDTGAPSAGMQALRQQDAPPSHAAFADAPDAPANKVAAQNVGIRATQPQAPQEQGLQPGQSDIRDPWGVSTPPPNLQALDEAYERMGQEEPPTRTSPQRPSPFAFARSRPDLSQLDEAFRLGNAR